MATFAESWQKLSAGNSTTAPYRYRPDSRQGAMETSAQPEEWRFVAAPHQAQSRMAVVVSSGPSEQERAPRHALDSI
jgi:hypothetical protein